MPNRPIQLEALPRAALRRRALGVAAAAMLCVAAAATAHAAAAARTADSPSAVLANAQAKIVKLYGAGGLRGLEAYQSGILISADGYVLTVFSYVLDTDSITAVLDDGRRLQATLVGADPRLEIAVLKLDAANLPHFDLAQAVKAAPGTRVFALSNAFGIASGDEPASVQHGVIAATSVIGGRGSLLPTQYRGSIYLIDAVTNNPGAAGGALITRRGELIALLGKELRNATTNTWLNYALPIAELRESTDAIRAGKFTAARRDEAAAKPTHAANLRALGALLVPDVLPRTPPYVDAVRGDSPAAAAGLRSDDLIVLVGDRLVQSCQALAEELEYADRDDPLRLTVLRGHELVEIVIAPAGEEQP